MIKNANASSRDPQPTKRSSPADKEPEHAGTTERVSFVREKKKFM